MIKCTKCEKESTHRLYDLQYYCDRHGFQYIYRAVTLFLPKTTSGGTKVLGVSRKNNPNDWGLPGGKVEATDLNDLDAIVREVIEECGIKVSNLLPLCTYLSGTSGRIVTSYTCTHYSGEPKPMKGEGICAWIEPNLLLKGSFGLYNMKLFRTIGWKV